MQILWIKAEIFNCTQETFGVMASCSFSKTIKTASSSLHMRILLAWGRPVPGYFYNVNISTQWNKQTNKQRKKNVSLLVKCCKSLGNVALSATNLFTKPTQWTTNTSYSQRRPLKEQTGLLACCSWFTTN